MRGVGGELTLRLEGPLQPVAHTVEGGGQTGYLAAALGQADAAGQVAAVGDGLRRGNNLLHGAEGQPGDQKAPQGRHHDQRRKQGPGQRHDDLHHAAPGVVGDGAPDPDSGGGDGDVIHIVQAVAALGLADVSLGQRQLLRQLRRGGARQQLALLVEHLGIHPVAEQVHIAEVQDAVLHLQPVGVAGHHGHHLGRRGLCDLIAVHEHHEHQHQGGNDHHHHGEPDGHADLDGDMSHTPSFSTQPMPRTVCSSFFSWPPSSFLRR